MTIVLKVFDQTPDLSKLQQYRSGLSGSKSLLLLVTAKQWSSFKRIVASRDR
eukprot:m.83178 g.83178  ORF g.83178 m.83178 type:complete len:52 (+) comp14646_c0_seq13:569-724(+)